MLTYLLLIAGFVLLIKGADFFVAGSSSVAKILKVPTMVIGLTVVAMGTSLPEASVSITAAMAGKNSLALSNVIGSNLFNLLVVLGCSGLLCEIPVQASMLKRDFPFSILITLLLLFMCIGMKGQDMIISRMDGILLLIIFVCYLVITVLSALKNRQNQTGSDPDEAKILSLPKTLLFLVGGVAAIVYGGDLVVDCASTIARNFGLTENLIGLTIVALGTSLPELVTSMVAARKKETDLAVGNVVGSNIFNILLILGSSSALHPILVTWENVYDMIILAVSSIILFLFAKSRQKISSKEALVLLSIYLLFFFYILLR